MPIWIKFPKLSVSYWGEATLWKIVSYLGQLIKVGTATLNKHRLWYTRVLVHIDISKRFSEELYYTNEGEELVTQ